MKCEIDARGLACPQPVVLAKKRMKDCTIIEITVDNDTARENLKRLAASSGWSYEDSASGDFFKIILKANNPGTSADKQETATSCINGETIVSFSSDRMGKGDDELGAILMKAFIHTLLSVEPQPSKLVFYNSGVKLAAEGSGVTDDLRELLDKGTDIIICGTCVNYFELAEKIKTGTISNMFDIITSLNTAARIIYP